MRCSDRYPLIITPHMAAACQFWADKMQFRIGFQSTWFVWLHAPDHSANIAFMSPDHPSAPPGPEPFNGQGISFELQVDDAATVHAALSSAGVPISYPLTDEPFGQRRFGFFDPAGLWVDICEQTEPEAGYWDRYMVA